jgi:hypothetical protein
MREMIFILFVPRSSRSRTRRRTIVETSITRTECNVMADPGESGPARVCSGEKAWFF